MNRKTVQAVLTCYGVQESEQSKLGRMMSDTADLSNAMLRFINRSPLMPDLVFDRQEIVQASRAYEAK